CAPLTVTFSDSSTGDVLSYLWDFGDGDTSTAQNPAHPYNNSGTYTVSLTVSDTCGSDTKTRTGYITVEDCCPTTVTADFSSDTTAGCAPLTVTFSDSSTGDVLSYLWGFGDGDTSPNSNPVHTYNSPGTYTVSLTVTDTCGSDTKTRADYILADTCCASAVSADFSAAPNSGCAPLQVTFADSSTGDVLSYLWSFGDGTPDTTVQNPTHIYTNSGTYTVSLTVSDTCGSDTETKTGYITVSGSTVSADFFATATVGCAPLAVDFSDSSIGDVLYWSWDFGDGDTSTAQGPSHLYNNPGAYTVSLTVSDTCGSDTETKTGYIVVGDTPTADFTADNQTPCPGTAVSFTPNCTGTVDSYSWDFGDGSGNSPDSNPSHTYNTTNPCTVTLVVTGACGTDTQTKAGYITVNASTVSADFFATTTVGCAPLAVDFVDSSTGDVLSYLWSFGDGTPDTTVQNPTHIYTNSGTYTVSLTVSDTCGSDTETKTGYITVNASTVSADFSATATVGCAPLTVDFSDSSTGDVLSYLWSFGDGDTSTAQDPSHLYNNPGAYTVSLTVSDTCGTDTETKTGYITVNGSTVSADFLATTTAGCAPLTIDFADSSTGDVLSYLWSFGDGDTSTAQGPSHLYNGPGTYTVSLTVSDTCGSDTETKTGYITVNQPPTANAGTDDNVCSGDCIALNGQATGGTPGYTYLWTPNDGSLSDTSDSNPTACPDTTTTYTLTVTDSNGCTGTNQVVVTVNICLIPPTVSSITPNTGMVNSWVTVTIVGTNFQAGAVVKLSKNSVITGTGTTVMDSATLTTTFDLTGAETDTWDVVVTNPDARADTLTNGFTVIGCSDIIYVDGATGSDTNDGLAPTTARKTIGAGIEAACEGGTVCVAPGTYNENVNCIKTVNLVGAGSDSTTIDGSGTVIVFDGVGGSISKFTITGGTGTNGHGIWCKNGASPGISNNTITGNGSHGIYCNNSSPIITNNIITGNDRHGLSCSNSSPTITNNTITGNGEDGIECINSSSPIITNNIITSNDTSGGHAGISANVTSSPVISYNDVWGNTTDYSGNCSAGTGDISSDPLFVDGADSDFHLKSCSPCKDAGSNTAPQMPNTDQDGNPRPYNGGIADMGAYEYQGTVLIANAGADVDVCSGTCAILNGSATGGSGGYTYAWTPVTGLADPGDSVTNACPTTTTEYTLTVTDGNGCTDSNQVVVIVSGQAPAANFTVNDAGPCSGQPACFTDQSTNSPTSWSWDLDGDGNVDTTIQNPCHIYNTPVTYTVTLTASNDCGSDTETKTGCITVNGPTVSADFSATTAGCAPLTVTFSDSSTGDVLSYLWGFGDGDTSPNSN
ncbi:PKD domain-containing protein, partial [bacterium]|nr:PKD domain-containing protein [bacterium]